MGIQVNCKMGLSEKEHAEIRKIEVVMVVLTESGLVVLYFSDGSAALNGVSSGALKTGRPPSIETQISY